MHSQHIYKIECDGKVPQCLWCLLVFAVCVYVPLVFPVSVSMVPLVSVSVNCVATVRSLDASDVGECTQ